MIESGGGAHGTTEMPAWGFRYNAKGAGDARGLRIRLPIRRPSCAEGSSRWSSSSPPFRRSSCVEAGGSGRVRVGRASFAGGLKIPATRRPNPEPPIRPAAVPPDELRVGSGRIDDLLAPGGHGTRGRALRLSTDRSPELRRLCGPAQDPWPSPLHSTANGADLIRLHQSLGPVWRAAASRRTASPSHKKRKSLASSSATRTSSRRS